MSKPQAWHTWGSAWLIQLLELTRPGHAGGQEFSVTWLDRKSEGARLLTDVLLPATLAGWPEQCADRFLRTERYTVGDPFDSQAGLALNILALHIVRKYREQYE